MTDEQKLTHLLKVLKSYAETEHCYENLERWDGSFEVGVDYGEILFARTLLEQIGVEFQYPCMKEE
jgi:hypothetical protein